MAAEVSFPTAEINAALRAVEQRAGKRAGEALDLAAEAIVAEAQFRSPVRTGALQASHGVVQRASSSGRKSVRIGATIRYAAVVHETHKSKRHWFINAVVAHGPRIIQRALERVLSRG